MLGRRRLRVEGKRDYMKASEKRLVWIVDEEQGGGGG